MTVPVSPAVEVDLGELRQAIQAEYAEVALFKEAGQKWPDAMQYGRRSTEELLQRADVQAATRY